MKGAEVPEWTLIHPCHAARSRCSTRTLDEESRRLGDPPHTRNRPLAKDARGRTGTLESEISRHFIRCRLSFDDRVALVAKSGEGRIDLAAGSIDAAQGAMLG